MLPTMSKVLGQPVLVENVPGAGGSIGVQRVLNAPADGYTLLVGSSNDVVLAPLAMASVKYKPEDLQMLAPISMNPLVIMARKGLEASNPEQLVALGKKAGSAKPVSYGSVGYGSIYHIVPAYFGQRTGMDLLHVPYKGTAPLIQDLAAGQIDFAILPNVGTPTQLLEAGKTKALAILDSRRMPTLPQTQAITESALKLKDFQYAVWAGALVRPGIPADRLKRLFEAVQQGIRSEAVEVALEPSGVKPLPNMSMEKAAQFFREDTAKFQNIAKSIKLQAE
jgi:tripartite-type tricarboxylate transporter receptor subunit TctC